MLSNKELSEYLYDETIRIERLVFIGGLDEDISHFNPANEFLSDLDEKLIRRLLPDWPWLSRFLEDGSALEDIDQNPGEFFFEARENGFFGYLIQAAHPVMDFDPDIEGASFSWGYYCTQWFYGESLEEVLPKIEVWVKEMDQAQKDKVKKG